MTSATSGASPDVGASTTAPSDETPQRGRRNRRGGRRERADRKPEGSAVTTPVSLVEETPARSTGTDESSPNTVIEPADALPDSEPAFQEADTRIEPLSLAEVPAVIPGAVPIDVTPYEGSREQAVETLPPVPIAIQFTAEDTPPAKVETSASTDTSNAWIVPESNTSSAPPPATTETADLPATLEGSGLVMVETSPSEAQSWEAQTLLETAPTPRRRRAPPPLVHDDEPLVQIETGK